MEAWDVPPWSPQRERGLQGWADARLWIKPPGPWAPVTRTVGSSMSASPALPSHVEALRNPEQTGPSSFKSGDSDPGSFSPHRERACLRPWGVPETESSPGGTHQARRCGQARIPTRVLCVSV